MFNCQRIFTKFDYILGHKSKCNTFYMQKSHRPHSLMAYDVMRNL